ncbi:MAG TPA: hypothetical protein VJU15_08455 [Gemmatimonadales bacterium]|nr:hypothetical protein [Gemmatimonadales bacterium]
MKTRSLILVALLAIAPSLTAQAKPTGDELYNRYLEAAGGRAAMQKITSRHVWGHFEVEAQGLTGPIEILNASPMKMLTKIEIPGMGSTSTGLNGETGWMLNPAMGPMLVEGTALDQMKQQSDMDALLNPSKYVTSRETTGEANHGGSPCWVVTVTTTWKETYTECYDKASGLLSATIRKQNSPMGELEGTTVYTEYKSFDGVKMATVIKASTMGIEQVVRIDSISTKPIPDSAFELPSEIKALKKP